MMDQYRGKREREREKSTKINFKKIYMLNDEIKKKINFKKGQKKNHSQLMLTFETCDVVIRLRLIV